jgi:hypothetical protein
MLSFRCDGERLSWLSRTESGGLRLGLVAVGGRRERVAVMAC